MENNKLIISVKNSETSLKKGKRNLLAYPSSLFMPCFIKDGKDDFEIVFDCSGMAEYTNIFKKDFLSKVRLLYNCAEFFQMTANFEFSLKPENIYYDVNLVPRILRRDIGCMEEERFLSEYKALIGSTLASKYTFEDYYDGGSDLYGKNKLLKVICCANTVEEVAEALLSLYEEELARVENRMTLVRSNRWKFYRTVFPIFFMVVIACALWSFYVYFDVLTFDKQLLRGNRAYLNNDYIGVQKSLKEISVEDLPDDSKYILARSYVISESLSPSQKDNVLTMLTPQTDSIYFDYWIELGRLDFESAVDSAKLIGDDQLLLFSYIKYEAFLEKDTHTMSGADKANKMDDLKRGIEELSKELKESRNGLVVEEQR